MGDVQVIVELFAHTIISNYRAMYDAGWKDNYAENSSDRDILAEFAGRLCYQSWDRPNEATRTNQGYLDHILEVQHTSVLEHASAAFYVAEVSRSLLMELRTHRHLSFSALSQRYVDESEADYILPPAVQPRDHKDHPRIELKAELDRIADEARESYRNIYAGLERLGLTRKQAREAARSVMPNATATKFVVSGNLWAWRYVLAKRVSPGADAEMQLVAKAMLTQLKEIAPNTFQGM